MIYFTYQYSKYFDKQYVNYLVDNIELKEIDDDNKTLTSVQNFLNKNNITQKNCMLIINGSLESMTLFYILYTLYKENLTLLYLENELDNDNLKLTFLKNFCKKNDILIIYEDNNFEELCCNFFKNDYFILNYRNKEKICYEILDSLFSDSLEIKNLNFITWVLLKFIILFLMFP